MSLASGTRLGPYEVLGPLGAGGMGEVYRARDLRLDRTVAIKILPQQLSNDPVHKQRFEREARAVSSLNHPHICTLHDVGHQDGTDFLVMEYLEGESLAKRLERGPLPTPQLLRTAIEIADALEKAHRQGVIHRDLKPSNVMLTKTGAKLLDFGLAKTAVAPDVNLSNSPTMSQRIGEAPTSPLTAAGSIVGTFQYMSPEQLEGKEADARSDIFALGALMYEMATGQRAFTGKSPISVASAILEKDPEPISKTRPLVPAALDHVVFQCVAKIPDDRFQSAHDVGLELKWISETKVGEPSRPPWEGRALPYRALPWVVAGIFLVAAIVSTRAYLRLTEVPTRAIVFEIPPPAKSSFEIDSLDAATPVLSADGSRLAFVATRADGKQVLWIRSLDSTEAQSLQGTEDAMAPFWSPDGRYLGFFAGGKLKKVGISGGAPVDVCDALWGRGGAWAVDGTIIFAPDISSALYRVSEGGGTPMAVTTLDPSRQDTSQRWPQFLPDGQHFIFYAVSSSGNDDGTYVGSVDGGSTKLVLKGRSSAIYATGYLLFPQGTNLMAQRFDLSHLQLVGDPAAIAGNMGVLEVARRSLVGASDNGVLGYWTVNIGSIEYQLQWFDRAGKTGSTIGSSGALNQMPRLSADGKRLVTALSRPGAYDLWVYNLAQGIPTRLTFSAARNVAPVWSPDGTMIAFASNQSGLFQIYEKSADGSGTASALLKGDSDDTPSSWSSDGRYLAFNRRSPGAKSSFEIWILPVFGERKPFPFLTAPFNEHDASFSPDGKWLAYASDESGRDEVYVAPFPKANGKWRVSTDGGSAPRWRADGKELFYLAANAKVIAVTIVERSDSIESSGPHALMQANTDPLVALPYDVTADGKRFVLVTHTVNATTVPITLLVKWPALLKKQ